MSPFPASLPEGSQIGNYQIQALYRQATNHTEYLATDLRSGKDVLIWESSTPNTCQRDASSSLLVPIAGREAAFEAGKELFLSASPGGDIERFAALNTCYIVYPSTGPVVAVAPENSGFLNNAAHRPKRMAKKKGSSGVLAFFSWIIILGILGAGAYYGWQEYEAYQNEQIKERDAIQAENKRKEAEREQRRLEELEAKRQRQQEQPDTGVKEPDKPTEPVVEDTTPDDTKEEPKDTTSNEDEDSPFAKDDDPRLDLFKKPTELIGLNAERNTALVAEYEAALKTAFETKRWDKYKDFIFNSLQAETKRLSDGKTFDMKKFAESTKYRTAMYDYTLLNKLSKEEIYEVTRTYGGEEFWRSLITNDKDMLQTFLRSIDGKESSPELVRILQSWVKYWTLDPEPRRSKYASLALACSLIDEAQLGGCKTRYGKALTMDEIYAFFRDKSEAGALKGNIPLMKPEHLIYVVDVRLPLSELEWAIKNVNASQKGWGDATIGMVRYRMDRAAHAVDPYKDYTFAEIKKEGGICMDQAYFAVNTAKANGIPATYVTGDGPMGGHAWIAFMPDSRTWVDANNLGYTSGEFMNPQTKEKQHENLLLMTTDKKVAGDRLSLTKDLIELSNLMLILDQEAVAKSLLEQAIQNTRAHPLPWEATIAFYEREDKKPATTLKEWEALSTTIRNSFRKRPDFLKIAEYIDDTHIFPNQSAEETASDLGRQRRALERSTDEGRADLSKSALQRQADALIAAKKFEEVSTLYRLAFREYGARTDALEGIFDQYFGYAGENEEWRKAAVSEMDRAYSRYVDTGSADLFKAKKEIGVAKKIAGFYEKIGNTQRANLIRKAAERRQTLIERRIKKE